MKSYQTFLFNHEFTFTTDNGVFSKNSLDFGTRVLLETLPLSTFKGEILDVGCGYGVIGIVVGKLTNCSITMCDVNKRALHLAMINARQNEVTQISVIESDCYKQLDLEKKFDVIITNPPIRAGKKVVYEIVMGARHHLSENGSLFIVVRKEQGAKSMIEDLKEFYQVTILNKIKGFFVIKCILD